MADRKRMPQRAFIMPWKLSGSARMSAAAASQRVSALGSSFDRPSCGQHPARHLATRICAGGQCGGLAWGPRWGRAAAGWGRTRQGPAARGSTATAGQTRTMASMRVLSASAACSAMAPPIDVPSSTTGTGGDQDGRGEGGRGGRWPASHHRRHGAAHNRTERKTRRNEPPGKRARVALMSTATSRA